MSVRLEARSEFIKPASSVRSMKLAPAECSNGRRHSYYTNPFCHIAKAVI